MLLLLCLLGGAVAQSCDGRCGDSPDFSLACQCNTACGSHGDCCQDYPQVCQAEQSCAGQCSAGYDPALPCQCNSECPQHGNCCPDFDTECGGGGGGLSDGDLLELGELLLAQDDANVGGQYVLDMQCTTSTGNTADCSPFPLFESVEPAVLALPVYVKLARLYDNYGKAPSQVEDHTAEEISEEHDFLNEVLMSSVMNSTYYFLTEKGAFTGTWEEWGDHLYTTWFGMYDRAREVLGSSGFEHVFIGEVKGGVVSGFHNWFHWYTLESQGELNYLGHWESVSFGEGRGGGLSFTYTWQGVPKPFGSMFLGTSPSLEMALYTTCLLVRPDAKCHTSLGGQAVYIQTWQEVQHGNIYVGSSYPDWAP